MPVRRLVIVRPLGRRVNSRGEPVDFDAVERDLVGPVVRALGLEGARALSLDSATLTEEACSAILDASLVLFDLTIEAPSVFYVLGIRHALRRGGTVPLCGKSVSDGTIPAWLAERCIVYDWRSPAESQARLTHAIAAALGDDFPGDSPLFQMFPELAAPSLPEALPVDFLQDVERARAAGSKGWLRLLAREVKGLPFEREGLRLIARGQRELEDEFGSRQSWEALVERRPEDFEANVELVRLYEGLLRETEAPEVLELLDASLERALKSEREGNQQRMEVLELQGSCQRSRFWAEWERGATLSEQDKTKASLSLFSSYESYLAAFLHDLNHFDPGVAALQNGTVLLHLSTGRSWTNVFPTHHQADNYLAALTESVASLQLLVPRSIEAALRRAERCDPRLDTRARMASAETAFLTNEDDQSVVDAYRAADPSVSCRWAGVTERLERFARIGIRPRLAREILREIADRTRVPYRSPRVHVVVFTGCSSGDEDHDLFPSSVENQTRAFFRETIPKLAPQEGKVVSLASAATGREILWHEACDELGIESTICLPMPLDELVQRAFAGLTGWQARLSKLIDRGRHPVLVLSKRPGLPRWLEGRPVAPRRRGNEWVMEMALAYGAQRVTLVAVSDRGSGTDDRTGEDHMVRLARESGIVEVRRVDATSLLGV